MKRIICSSLLSFLFALWTVGTATGQPTPATSSPAIDPTPTVVVLSSEEVQHVPRVDHVRKMLRHVIAKLTLARSDMPHIVMMYVRRSEAKTQHLPNVSITVEQARGAKHPLYHVWIVDDVRDLATAHALIMVLNDNFDLRMDEAKVRQVRDRVLDALAMTVDYHALAEGK